MSQMPEFQRVSVDGPEPVLFTGEIVFRDLFKDYDELRNLQETADLLAYAEDWPELYDETQLAKNEVRIYSAVYVEDMLVHFDLSRVCTSSEQNLPFSSHCLSRKKLSGKTATDYPILFFRPLPLSESTDFRICIGRSLEDQELQDLYDKYIIP